MGFQDCNDRPSTWKTAFVSARRTVKKGNLSHASPYLHIYIYIPYLLLFSFSQLVAAGGDNVIRASPTKLKELCKRCELPLSRDSLYFNKVSISVSE